MGSPPICFITYQSIYPGTLRFTSLFGKSVKYSAVWMFLNLGYCLLMIFSTLLLVSLSFFFFNLFTWLRWVLVAACKTLGRGVWDLVPWPGIEPGPSALGAWNFNHWTTRDVPLLVFSLLSSSSSSNTVCPQYQADLISLKILYFWFWNISYE